MLSAEMLEIVGPALAAGLIIALTHAPLGIEVMKRGIIFIDLAIAQVAGLGLVAAALYLHEPAWWVAQSAALGCALLAAFFFRWIEHKCPEQQEAIIGSSFVLAASMALLLLADHPHGGEKIQHLLSGQILFVTWRDVLVHSPIYIMILACWFIVPTVRSGLGFYLLFALAITSSVQLAGVYVVFSSLILPALASEKAKRQVLTAWSVGIVSVLAGVVFAAVLDLPAGPVVVLSYTLAAIAARYVCPPAKRRAVSGGWGA
ncbi:MAG: metal ABC transporter permease [Proteobacteria bacterium]|nr:metal ABC transporter permease [Pseudomonadota bacterium]MBU1547552.1 metal ABC transporter permease [Pseudomonadota bacterium]MBU2619834.1 metal ABC transporter permease [Pseudomonadota bacterium]